MKKDFVILNRRYTLTYSNGFVLSGVVVDHDEYGIMFQTHQKTSFIAWNVIATLVPLE